MCRYLSSEIVFDYCRECEWSPISWIMQINIDGCVVVIREMHRPCYVDDVLTQRERHPHWRDTCETMCALCTVRKQPPNAIHANCEYEYRVVYGRWLCDCVSSFAYLKYSSTIYPISQVIIVYINYYLVTESCIVRLCAERQARWRMWREAKVYARHANLHSRIDVLPLLGCTVSTRRDSPSTR